MNRDPKKEALHTHKRRGKKLVPPFLAALGEKYSPYSWTRELVPELLWIWLCINRHGFRRGLELSNALGLAASNIADQEPEAFFATISSFKKFSKRETDLILQNLSARDKEELATALSDFFKTLEESPLHFLKPASVEGAVRSTVFETELQALYDRYGRAAAWTLATATYMGICQGKIKFSASMMDDMSKRFENIADYPDTEASRSAAGAFRAGAPMFLMLDKEGKFQRNEAWLQYFWDSIGEIGQCISSTEELVEEPLPEDTLGKIIFSFRNAAIGEMKERLEKWGFDLHNIEVTEVVGALICRQAELAIQFSLSPAIWTPSIAPLILRAMADVYVTVAWILKDRSKERAAMYVEDGLGAIILEISHRKAAFANIDDEQEQEESRKYIDMLQAWLDSQRLEQLVSVNLGSWSGKSTRVMAEEAGCVDFYNYVYQPFSASVHSSWVHIGRFNMVHCQNPAHRAHGIPTIVDFDYDVYWLYLGAKYLQKTFALFDESTGVSIERERAFDLLLRMLDVSSEN